MVREVSNIELPKTIKEFLDWEPNDGFKYEWNDDELIKFNGMKRKQLFIFETLTNQFYNNRKNDFGILIPKADVELSAIQMRRPDIAYFTNDQIKKGRNDEDIIPEFVIEVISGSDLLYQVDKKLTEYFKYGVKVVWLVLAEAESVHVYTSRQHVKICYGEDICSASPVLDGFEITVNQLFA